MHIWQYELLMFTTQIIWPNITLCFNSHLTQYEKKKNPVTLNSQNEKKKAIIREANNYQFLQVQTLPL